MTERIIGNQIRLIPYYRNDAVSLPWYQDRDVWVQENRYGMVSISALKRLWGMGGEEDKAGSKYVNRNHDYWSVRKWKDNTGESGC